MQTYAYERLKPDQIRLLGLDGRRSSDTFFGELHTVNLSDTPRYFCLSYTWGHASDNVPIHVDGQTLHVRPSLVDTLHRLQDLAEEGSSPDPGVNWVWIDRICINQDDDIERADQVRAMGRIYSQSVRTIIWAGPDLNGASAAWQLIDKIYDICKTQNPGAKYLADIPWRIYSDETHAASGLPPWDDIQWDHLRALFELPYFTRTWIIQEVALSTQDPMILHGTHRYSWERLGWAASWLRRNGYLRLNHMPDQLQNCDTISNIRRSRERWQLDALLATAVVKFKSTDQHDKVYGMLGLAAETMGEGGIPEALNPDYSLEIWEVYTKVILFFLRKYRILPSLCHANGLAGDKCRAQHVTQYDEMPTWVPNWSDCSVSNSEFTKTLSWLYYSNTGAATKYGFPEHSNACAGLPAEVLDSEQEKVLRIKGIITGKVVRVVPYKEDNRGTEEESLWTAWRTLVQALPDSNVASLIKAFIHASTAEQYQLSGKSEEQMIKDGSAFLLRGPTSNGNQENHVDHIDNVQQTLATSAIGGRSESYFSLARNYCHNRSLVVTSKGRIGISSWGTHVGDFVTVIFGGGVPYVIRREDDHFLFVGESYVDGLMHGEAIQEWNDGKLKEEVLEFY